MLTRYRLPCLKCLSLLTLAMLLLACAPKLAAAPQQTYEERAVAMPTAGFVPAAPVAESAEIGDYTSGASFADETASTREVKRLVIKNANLTIVVEDPNISLETISQMAEDMGGFVVSSNLYKTELENGKEALQAAITVRVPAERFTEAVNQIKAAAIEVTSEESTGQDVTQEYTDLESRKRNLEVAEAQLQEIMESATRTEDVLAVHNQLTQVREQIEVIQGQMQYYEQSAAFSAISVTILSKEAVQPLTIGKWEPVGVARDAVQATINVYKFLINAAIVILLTVLPAGVGILAIIVAILLLLRLAWRTIKRTFGWGKPKPPKPPKEQKQATAEMPAAAEVEAESQVLPAEEEQ